MLSKYFETKTKSDEFKQKLNSTLEQLKDKKVILYGAGEGFFDLDKTYNFKDKLNIVAIADKKFEKNKNNITGLVQIEPNDILKKDFDCILITNERPKSVYNFLISKLEIDESKIYKMFCEELKDEANNFYYLYEHRFDKTLPQLVKKLKNKKVVLYGAGAYLQLIMKCFDLSQLDIIGISDKKFDEHEENETFNGLKVYSIDEVESLKPDYIIVATKFYTGIIEDLYYNKLRNTNIKIKPLVKKGFFELLREIW